MNTCSRCGRGAVAVCAGCGSYTCAHHQRSGGGIHNNTWATEQLPLDLPADVRAAAWQRWISPDDVWHLECRSEAVVSQAVHEAAGRRRPIMSPELVAQLAVEAGVPFDSHVAVVRAFQVGLFRKRYEQEITPGQGVWFLTAGTLKGRMDGRPYKFFHSGLYEDGWALVEDGTVQNYRGRDKSGVVELTRCPMRLDDPNDGEELTDFLAEFAERHRLSVADLADR